MVLETVRRIRTNLEAIKALLKTPGHEEICGGLYTFAIEEYGKILLLQNCGDSPVIDLKYKNGFRKHEAKFELAINDLSDDCLKIESGGYTDAGFTSTGYTKDKIADLDARLGIFYMDFTDDVSHIKPIPSVSRASLEGSLESFECHLNQKFSQ
ncbi:MAG: hypothetical protein ABI361_03270 [Nitrososphaera sp.]|jgi:hypothetical protein